MKVPFEYGALAEDEYFIDRVEERKDLKSFLGGGINVMLISPRRWGKSSLVKKAMNELQSEDKTVRVCYLDAFKVTTIEDFYNKFASTVIQGTSSSIEKRWNEAVKFIQHISPNITIGGDPNNTLKINFSYRPIQESEEVILNLPETIAKAKNLHVIVCIDEFQQLANLPQWKHLEGTMRSVWQQQQHTNYCLYGSKWHMMLDIFGNSNNPFYRFGQLLTLSKIDKNYWIPFITKNFADYGKHISEAMANKVCDTVECHSWYVQQLCFLIWTHTDKEVTEDIFDSQMKMLLDTNADMFLADIERLSPTQVAFLKAVAMGVEHFNAKDVVATYNLGSPRIITKNKQTLVEKDILEKKKNRLYFVDPVFRLWFIREFC